MGRKSKSKGRDVKPKEGEPRKMRYRSPNCPCLDLGAAVEAVARIYKDYKRHAVPSSTVHAKWGLKENSSAGNQRVAALKAFGLVVLSGTGKDRRIAVSAAGERIVRNAPDRHELVKAAVLSPAMFKELWDKWKDDDLPPDDLIKQYLVWDRKGSRFNEDSAEAVIANFKQSIVFAKIAPGDIIDTGEDGDEDDETGRAEGVAPLRTQRVIAPEPAKLSFKVQEPTVSTQDVFHLGEGPAILQVPNALSEASYEDLEEWLTLALRKIKRRVRSEQPPEGGDTGDS